MSQGAIAGDHVTVVVSVTNTDGIHTAGFDVVFDPAAVEFAGFAPGVLLEQSGNSPTYQADAQSGRLVVGVSREGGTPTNANGTRALIGLTFRVRRAGSHTISFQNAALLTETQTRIAGISWHAGAVVGTE
jgi:hypothetical protein